MQVIMYVSGGGAVVQPITGNVQILPMPEGTKVPVISIRNKELSPDEISHVKKIAEAAKAHKVKEK